MTTNLQEAWTTPATPPPSDADRLEVEACVRDYFEGWWEGDAERMARALHPALVKRSYATGRDRAPVIDELSADMMITATATGRGKIRKGDRLDIDIAELGAGMASVVGRTDHYVDCLHMIHTPDGWRIINVLWRWADGHGPRD